MFLDTVLSIPGPELPFSLSGHCMVQVDSESVYIIGGRQNETTSNQTWIVNVLNFGIREGPKLNVSRSGHSCGKMYMNGRPVIVTAGGYSDYRWMGQTLDSVEILDPASNKGWIFGKHTQCGNLTIFLTLRFSSFRTFFTFQIERISYGHISKQKRSGIDWRLQ